MISNREFLKNFITKIHRKDDSVIQDLEDFPGYWELLINSYPILSTVGIYVFEMHISLHLEDIPELERHIFYVYKPGSVYTLHKLYSREKGAVSELSEWECYLWEVQLGSLDQVLMSGEFDKEIMRFHRYNFYSRRYTQPLLPKEVVKHIWGGI